MAGLCRRVCVWAMVLAGSVGPAYAQESPGTGPVVAEVTAAAATPVFPTPGIRPPPPPFSVPEADPVIVSAPMDRVGSASPPSTCGAEGQITFETPVRAETEIVIAAVGDVLLHARLQRQAFAHADGFASLWSGVSDIIAAADIAYANLEGPIAPGITKDGSVVDPAPDRFDDWVYSSYPLFNYPPRLAGDLRTTGFDIVSTANNHSLDRFGAGADLTIDAVRQAGLAFSGTRPRSNPGHPWHAITQVGDATIAWLACTYGTNGIPDRAGQVLWCYENRETVLQTIAALAADETIDAVVFTPHWGVEYVHAPRPPEVDLAHAAIEAGAVAVIGNHPHVLQPYERVVASDGREGLIHYSIGNFVSGQRELPRRSTAVLLVGLAEMEDGRWAMAGVRHVPLRMIEDPRAPDGRRMRVEATDRVGDLAARAHIDTILPSANAIPADAPLTTLSACDADRLVVAGAVIDDQSAND